MNISYAVSHLENVLNFARGCSVSVRTNEGDVSIFAASGSKSHYGRPVSVYSGDIKKGLIAAVVAFALFSGKGLLSTIGFASLTIVASTFQISYRSPKVEEVIKKSKFIWW